MCEDEGASACVIQPSTSTRYTIERTGLVTTWFWSKPFSLRQGAVKPHMDSTELAVKNADPPLTVPSDSGKKLLQITIADKCTKKRNEKMLNFTCLIFFEYFIILSQMQFKIFLQHFEEIEVFFVEHLEFKNQFLGLFLKVLEMNIVKRKNHQFRLLYKKFQKLLFQKQTFRQQEKQKCFKSFIQEEEGLFCDFLYLKQSDLKLVIKEKWNSVPLMKKLFQFIIK